MKLEINHKSPVPLHAQVEALLRKLIGLPEYQDGKFLPNEVDLAKRLGISRNTVRQATSKLVLEGLLIRKKGVGTRVAARRLKTRLDNWMSFTEEMHRKGIEFENLDTRYEWEKADDELAGILEVSRGTEVLKLTRVRGMKKKPIVEFISYFHPRIGLTGRENFERPLYEILEKEHSIIPAISKEEIQALVADKKMADVLKISQGDPILFRKRLVCDPGDRIIEYNLGYYRADKFTYTIEIHQHKIH